MSELSHGEEYLMLEPHTINFKFLTSETSFVIGITANFQFDENGFIVGSEPSTALYDLLSCFADIETSDDGISNLKINPYVKYDETIKSKLESFINKYKNKQPVLNAVEKKLKSIKLNEYICIFPFNIELDTEQTMEIYNELSTLNGEDSLLIPPILKEYNFYTYGELSHTNIGHYDKRLRKCRWCGKSIKDGATFNKVGHAISEALGNKNLVLLDECDDCNEFFGETIERSIISHFQLFSTLFGVRGKRGVPKIKDEAKNASIEYLNKKEIKMAATNENVKFKNGRPCKFFINITKHYKFQDVYKSLCKYALSVVEDEKILSSFSEIIQWIKGEKNIEKLPVVKVLQSYHFFPEHPILNIFIRKSERKEYPLMFAEFQYKNFVMVYIVPQDQKETEFFLNNDNFNKFWNLTFYKDVPNWNDQNFSDNVDRRLDCKLKFEQNPNKPEK